MSNSSLSQNEDELREKQNYLILKQSLKALQERANHTFKKTSEPAHAHE